MLNWIYLGSLPTVQSQVNVDLMWIWINSKVNGNHEITTQKQRGNFLLPHQDLNDGPLEPIASVLPMRYADPLIDFYEQDLVVTFCYHSIIDIRKRRLFDYLPSAVDWPKAPKRGLLVFFAHWSLHRSRYTPVWNI